MVTDEELVELGVIIEECLVSKLKTGRRYYYRDKTLLLPFTHIDLINRKVTRANIVWFIFQAGKLDRSREINKLTSQSTIHTSE